MRILRAALYVAIGLVAIQLAAWTLVGRGRLADVAFESFFNTLETRGRVDEMPPLLVAVYSDPL